MTCQPGNLSTNHLNATISGNDFSCPVMLLEDHGRYMRRFADCVFPSLFGLCRLAIYPAIAFTAQPQRTGKRMRFTVNIGAHFCRRELFFIWLMLPLSGGVIEKCAAADKDTKKSWAAIVNPSPASLYPGRTSVRPHASPVPESSMLQWPPVLTTSKTHAEVPSRQQESSEATVRTHPKRRPDRKRQYYRNPSAERFDQQIEALANEVNRLKKQLHGPHRESHKTALLDLAFQMTEREPHPLRASPKALALLANAFSKLAKYQEGATALDWIMKAVIHRSQKQQLTKQCGFNAQNLAMVLNSLSQVAGDDADTTRKALAKEVGRRDLTDPREWSAQHLALVASGMSHCSHVIGEDVVQASIQAIMNISPTEQDIIMTLDALCRLSLSDDQLKLGYFLVKRLCDMTGFIGTGGPLQHNVGDFLWNLAVLDLCAKQNPLIKDDPDTPRFDIFVKPLMDRENIRDLLSHHWQDRFAYIYWAGISNRGN